MKTKILFASLLLPIMAMAGVKYNESDLNVSNVSVTKNAQTINVAMNMDYTAFPISSNQELVVTPMIKNNTQSVQLPSVIFAGHNRYYSHKRNADSDANIPVLRNGKKALYDYTASTAYQSWMNESELIVNYQIRGCCGADKAEFAFDLQSLRFTPPTYTADYLYIPPVAERVKTRQETGTAFIDFVVNKTAILPDFHNNAAELAKITKTINNVKDDPDITLNSMEIKGYASPEGGYENNVRLAKGRTEALEQYVQKLYSFPQGFIKTSSDPANFQGLEAWLDTNSIENKGAIIDIIKSDLEPQKKNAKIKSSFPKQYAWLLANVYPSLRKSDYKVDYTVKSYTDVQEIINVMQTAPNKLSLSEFYLAAQSMKPGSKEFNNVFDTAVKMYPNDEVANLNAANSAMQRGDLVSAGTYLTKAGNSQQAQYARGVLAALNKDYTTAENIFSQLQNIEQAQKALAQLQAIKAFQGN